MLYNMKRRGFIQTDTGRSGRKDKSMNNFEFYSPTCFVFGKDTESNSGE